MSGDPYAVPQWGAAGSQPYSSPYQAPPPFGATGPVGRSPGRGLAISSLVLGIVAVLGVLLVFLQVWAGYYIGSIAGLGGLVLGIIAQFRSRSRAMSLAGLILSALGFAAAVLLLITAFVMYY